MRARSVRAARRRRWPSAIFIALRHVTLTMIRGGVITGRVTNAQDEPLIAMQISAVRVREAAGHPVTNQMTGLAHMTDDRGVYRFYGLTPGTYVVMANSGQPLLCLATIAQCHRADYLLPFHARQAPNHRYGFGEADGS